MRNMASEPRSATDMPSWPSRTLRWFLLCLLSLFSATSGCGETKPSPDAEALPSPGRIVVLGIDGIDPEVVSLLAAEGKLPNFAKLAREGASGRLMSSPPLLSPIIWTTIATGKESVDHQITDFAVESEATGGRLPVTSRMRKVKALWNILSEHDRSVGVVGWWATLTR